MERGSQDTSQAESNEKPRLDDPFTPEEIEQLDAYIEVGLLDRSDGARK